MTDNATPFSPDDRVLELPGAQPTWIWVHTCSAPKCDCRDVLVLASDEGRQTLLKRGAAIHQAWLDGSGYKEQLWRQTDLLHFNLDIDTAEVYWTNPSQERLDVSDHPRIGPIAKCIDGEVLDHIDTLWYLGKGLPTPQQRVLGAKEIVVEGWERGDLIAWNEIFAGVRQDMYILGRHEYEADELYCPIPECDCGQVVIQFAARFPRGAPHPGSVVVQSTGAMQPAGAVSLEPHRNGSARLEQLWTAFRTRHPQYTARFERRYRLMRSAGARFAPQTQAPVITHKVGRNDPCPCGSGKKHKRCCGAN